VLHQCQPNGGYARGVGHALLAQQSVHAGAVQEGPCSQKPAAGSRLGTLERLPKVQTMAWEGWNKNIWLEFDVEWYCRWGRRDAGPIARGNRVG
jgi:hypothetical protein